MITDFERHSRRRSLEKVREITADELFANGNDFSSTKSFYMRELIVEGLLSFGIETRFSFGKLNLLVGPNGSGKSNLIDCLRLLHYAPFDIQETFRDTGFDDWVYKGSNNDAGTALLQIVCSLPNVKADLHHQFVLGPSQRSRAPLEEIVFSKELDDKNMQFYFIGSHRTNGSITRYGTNRRPITREMSSKEYDPFRSILSQVRDAVQYPELTSLADFLSRIRIYSEWTFGRTSRLREATPAGRSTVYLSESMDDLALVLNGLERSSAHDQIRVLLKDLKETYVDYVTRVLFGRVGLELIETPFEVPIPAGRLSDGTLRFLALAAILLQPDPPPLICLEEPELGMHPDMIRMVASMMIDCSSKSQLIVSTHSEHLLSALQADFDTLFAFDAGVQGTSVRSFDRKSLSTWLKDHTLGELWSSGELGGNRW